MKIFLFAVLAAVMMLSFPQPSASEIKEGSIEIEPFGGYYFMHHKDRGGFGLRAGYNLTKNWGIEGAYDYAGYRAKFAHADLLYHLIPDGAFNPFVFIGGGDAFMKPADSGKYDKALAEVGVGFKYFFSDNIGFRADVRDIQEKYNNVAVTAGLVFAFGGKTSKYAQAAAPAPKPEPETAAKPAPEAPLEPVPAAEPTPGMYKYCITLHIEFDIDKADIRPEYHDEVAKVGDFMKKYPTTTAVIEGHTDNIASYEYNMALSQRRAESVVNYLVDKFGIERSRLQAKGYGFTRPVADNSTDAGKQANRRMEAIIDCAFDVKEVKPPDKLCMSLQMEFDSGKADIKPQYQDEIAKVGDYLKKYPTTTALIEGHTDNVGGAEYNMKLSQQRAENVVNYLVDKLGIERSRLRAKGYGSTRRIAYNTTPEGRQKNRRINAVIDCVIK